MAVGSSGGLAVVVMLVEEKVCRFYWPSFVDIMIRFLSFFFVFFAVLCLHSCSKASLESRETIFYKRTIVHK
jgi:hypothetical protein